jgi:hypothetical protein
MSDFHLKVAMSGDRKEDTRRRGEALGLALMHAATDPEIRAKMGASPLSEELDPRKKLISALGRAYSDIYLGVHRQVVIKRLRDLIRSDLNEIAQKHHQHLSELVRARSIGDRCGDFISKVQLELLSEAITPEELPPDAA